MAIASLVIFLDYKTKNSNLKILSWVIRARQTDRRAHLTRTEPF